MGYPPLLRHAGALLAATTLAAVAAAQAPTATANVTHHDAPVRGYRVGDDFLMPLDAVTGLSWSASRKGNTVQLIAEGRTLSLPVRRVGTAECLSLKAIAREMNAFTNWLPGYEAFEFMAPVDRITARDGKLKVESRLPVRASVATLLNPPRVVVDLEGARYSRSTKLALDSGAKVEQYRPNTVRIVYELPIPPVAPTLPPTPTEKIELDFFPVVTPIVPTTPAEERQQDLKPLIVTGQPVELRLGVELEGPTATLLTLGSPTAALRSKPIIRKPLPEVLEIVLPGIIGEIPDPEAFHSEAVTKVESRIVGKDTIVRLELASAMGGEVWSDSRGVSIQLLRPAIANGKVAGKVIVIDAGHGGNASGCHHGSLYEKNLTLAIAKYAAVELANLGATVIMTRKDDSNPSLDARPALANRNAADLFISIHINSPGKGSPVGGSEVYYHKSNSISKLLGECIMAGMQKYAKLTNRGVKSDRVLHPKSGLAVLRGAKMSAVLLEVGYITNPTDRAKMTSPTFQKATGEAIAYGVQRFLGAK